MNKDFLRKIYLFLLAVPLSSCFLWQHDPAQPGMAGTVQVIGNHPFEKLALFADNGSVFVIQASKPLYDEMMLLQGKKIVIQYSTMQRSEGRDVVNVVEFKTAPQQQ